MRRPLVLRGRPAPISRDRRSPADCPVPGKLRAPCGGGARCQPRCDAPWSHGGDPPRHRLSPSSVRGAPAGTAAGRGPRQPGRGCLLDSMEARWDDDAGAGDRLRAGGFGSVRGRRGDIHMLEPDDFPLLQTERLVLRRLTLEDAPAVFEFRSDPEVQRYNGGAMSGVEEAADLITLFAAGYRERTWIEWGVTLHG